MASKAAPTNHINTAVPDADDYYPLSDPLIGVAYPKEVYAKNEKVPKLFQPLTIRSVTFKNRIWVSPMCQYSSHDGIATDWHLVHLGGFAVRGAGAITVEATSVTPEGRITPEDAGLWSDEQIPPLKRIVSFVHAQGGKIGIQLAHAGRKASTFAPWIRQASLPDSSQVASAEAGGWPDRVIAPSAIPWSDTFPKPKAMSLEEIASLEESFAAAVQRCKKIGFDFIEIHGAHGYLIHSFYSPLSNKRTDNYGGTFENRTRLALQVAKRVRKEWDDDKPLFFRVSASDWAEGPEKGDDGEWKQWGIEQTKILAAELVKVGVDLIDTSSAGNWEAQKIAVGPGFQVPFAAALKAAHPNLLVGTVGLITDAKLAESYLQDGKADVVFLARELLRHVDWPLRAAEELGVAVKPSNQYERAWSRMLAGRLDNVRL